MSTTVRTLKAVLQADDQATAGLRKFNTTLNGLEKTVRGLIPVFSALAVADFLKGAVQEAAEAELVMAKFSSAAKSAGLNVKEATERAGDFATALARTSMFGDDAIVSAQQLLVSIGRLSGDGLERATRAAADLATGLGIDLDQAAKLLAKAAAGSTTGLQRLGIEADTLDDALTQVEARFGGMAKAATETTAGAIEQMTKGVGELKEAIGSLAIAGGLVFAVNELTDRIYALKGALEGDLPSLKEWIKYAAQAAAILTPGGAARFGAQLGASKKPGAASTSIDPMDQLMRLAGAGTSSPGAAAAAAGGSLVSGGPDIIARWIEDNDWPNLILDKIHSAFDFTAVDENALVFIDGLTTTLLGGLGYITDQATVDWAEMQRQNTEEDRKGAAARIAISKAEQQAKQEQILMLAGAISNFIGVAFGNTKGAAIAEAIINTAVGVTKALAQGGIFGPALAGIVIATGLAQIATIQRTNFSGYAQGGIIPGIDHGRDSVPIMARPGEAVLPKELTDLLLSSGGGVEIHLHGDLPALVTEINRQTKRGNVRLVASEVRTSGLTR